MYFSISRKRPKPLAYVILYFVLRTLIDLFLFQERTKRTPFRSKKEVSNEPDPDDPSEVYRRSQQLLESLLADKSDNAPDLNALFKPTRGTDLNNVSIDNLPTAFTNLRRFVS